ncbi:MAG TPA: tetratricopeptide repeat protein [Candidatus Dormibacteraeota bacterium]|nr:tetratricopeptide repeat protein [Candidatus Dormibacteraeota bacterium]
MSFASFDPPETVAGHSGAHPMQLPVDVLPEPGPLPAGSRMPRSRPVSFTGRVAELRRIASALSERRAAVLTGPEGSGKTALALEFARRYGRYFPGGVFWIGCSAPSTVALQLAACGRSDAMDLRPDFPDLSLDEQVRLVLGAWQGDTPRLLLYDDCDGPARLRDFLPGRGGAHILITSRSSAWDGPPRPAVLPVGPLPREHGVAMLGGFRPDLAGQPAALGQIARELDDLPLALNLAGGILAVQPGLTPDAYRQWLRDPGLEAHALQLEGPPEPPSGEPSHRPLGAIFGRRRAQPSPPARAPAPARAFVLALFALEQAGCRSRARALLARVARLAPAPIPEELLLATLTGGPHDRAEEPPAPPSDPEPVPAGGEDAREALAWLVHSALLERDGPCLWPHRRLAGYAGRTITDDEAQSAVERALITLAHEANQAGEATRQLLLAPHLEAATRAAVGRGEDIRVAQLSTELGRLLWALGDPASADRHLERALAIHERLLGPDATEAIDGLRSLGSLRRAQGDLNGARAYLEEARARAERVLGDGHPVTAAVIADLGWVLQGQGDPAGARSCLERAVELSERRLGEHPETAAARHGLGRLLEEQGELADARAWLERALGTWEATSGLDDPRTLACLRDVGMVRKAQGDLAGAQECLFRALEACERTLGTDHPETATVLDGVGTVLQARGNPEGALSYLRRALSIRERTFGPDHPVTAASLSNLGMLLRSENDLEGARSYLERALVISQRVLGPYDPQTATSLSQLGTLLQAQGDLVEAQPYLERAVAIREQALGADHPETAASLHDLGLLLIEQGDLVGARTYLERALEIREEVLGHDHVQTADTEHSLGTLLWQLGDPASALVYLERAVDVRERHLGPDHPETLASIKNLDALRHLLAGRSVAFTSPPAGPGPATWSGDQAVKDSS